MGYPKRSSGGVRQWALTMANALVERGYAVDMLCEAPRRKFIDEPLLDPRVGRVVLGKGLLAKWRLHRYIRRHPGLRLVAALNYYNIEAAKLKKRFGAQLQVMLTQRENLSADVEWRKPHRYRAAVRQIRQLFNEADTVVAVSRGLADDLRDNFGVDESRLHAIYNPAFRANFLESATAEVDHPWLRDKDRPVVIAAGRLHFVKGFGELLQAFAILRKTCDARLLILGEGKERRNLEQQVEKLGLGDAVQLPGRVGSVAPWMARSDLFVLSSRREGLPAVMIEALAIGLPVVSTRCPSGPEEILDNGRCGTLVEIGDIEGLARAMENVLTGSPVDREALRARAAEFSLDRALQHYLDLWRQAPRA